MIKRLFMTRQAMILQERAAKALGVTLAELLENMRGNSWEDLGESLEVCLAFTILENTVFPDAVKLGDLTGALIKVKHGPPTDEEVEDLCCMVTNSGVQIIGYGTEPTSSRSACGSRRP